MAQDQNDAPEIRWPRDRASRMMLVTTSAAQLIVCAVSALLDRFTAAPDQPATVTVINTKKGDH